ncbi:hypothetical protein [Pedobacter sp. JY14-1]|uniref:hypothetical protein n=1 Tax=Pedobacter sp. JY14-1 TaxID=3034151 RepID=UPI0023E0CF31|nr:hypothetical protein [Pedobacter sp. JY14-1]
MVQPLECDGATQCELRVLRLADSAFFTPGSAHSFYSKASPPQTLQRANDSDTIPFTLGAKRKVYVNAKLNGSVVRNIQLDLGAGGTVINEAAVKKSASISTVK